MKKVISVVLALVFLLSLSACATSTSTPAASGTSSPGSPATAGSGSSAVPGTSSKPASNKQISVKIGIPGEVGDLNMAGPQMECFPAVDAVFNVIFYPDPKTHEYKSDVLESWQMEGANTMVLKLRKDIVFSNGDKATAEDLLYSYTSFVDRKLAGWLDEAQVVPGESVVRDEYTVALKVKSLVEGFYNRVIVLLDKKWCVEANWDAEKWYNPVGSGPYYVYKNSPGESYTLRLKDKYWLRPVEDFYVNEYVITKYSDTSTAYMALEIGDIDFTRVAMSEYTRLVNTGKDKQLEASRIATGVTMNLYLPSKINPVWKNKSMREAIALGVNWVELDKTMYGSLAQPATSITPADGPVYSKPGTREFNPDKAKQLIAQAGYKPGEIKLTTTLFDGANYKAFGEGFTYYLNQIGINANITYADNATVFAVWAAGKTDFSIHDNVRGSASRNPCSSINIAQGTGAPFGYIENDQFQKLYTQLSGLFNKPVNERKPVADELQKLIFDEILVIPIHEDVVGIGFNTKVLTKQVVDSYVLGETDFRLSRMGLRSNWG